MAHILIYNSNHGTEVVGLCVDPLSRCLFVETPVDEQSRFDLIDIRLRDGAIVRARVVGDGPPLLLLGNMVSWQFWCYQIPAFARRYRVIAPEYRDREIPGQSALDALADDVPDLLGALGYDRALMIGHSIGAMVLERLMERQPEVIEAAVLANGFWRMRLLPTVLHHAQPWLVPALRAIYPRLPWVARQLLAFFFVWIDQHIFLHGEPAENKRRMFFGYTMTPDISMVLRVGAALEFHRPPDLRHATMPVLLVSGGEDRWVPTADAWKLAEHLPRGEHLYLPDVGHMSPMVVPDVFNRSVLAFLDRVAAAQLGAVL